MTTTAAPTKTTNRTKITMAMTMTVMMTNASLVPESHMILQKLRTPQEKKTMTISLNMAMTIHKSLPTTTTMAVILSILTTITDAHRHFSRSANVGCVEPTAARDHELPWKKVWVSFGVCGWPCQQSHVREASCHCWYPAFETT